MRLLLDTHVLLWHFEDSVSLSKTAKTAVNDPSNQLFISVASLWELSIKISLGKLRLEVPIREMVAGYVKTGTTILSIAEEHALATGSLPWHHRDPFDRMLVGQAQLEGLTILTFDPLVRQYDVPNVW